MTYIEAPLGKIGSEWSRPRDLNTQFDAQISRRISLGFPEAVGQSRGEYVQSFYDALQSAKEHGLTFGSPVFVEPRIPVATQAKLLGVDIAPSVWALPDTEKKKPYPAWLNILPNPGIDPIGFAFQEHSELPQTGDGELKKHLATPFEALAADIDTLLQHSFVYLAGKPGLFTGQRLLVLDTWLGTPRISGANRGQPDFFTGALIAISGKEEAL